MFATPCRTVISSCSRLARHRSRHVHSEPPAPKPPNYREIADQQNNPYRDQFSYGRKPRTFRERYIESKKNEAKPKIGTGDVAGADYLAMKTSTDRKYSFYSDERRCRFSDLCVMMELGKPVAELGVVVPTAVQSEVIPTLLQKQNCVFIGPTGSGKTYTYLLPSVQSVIQSKKEGYITRSQAPRIIIMAPTKYLAIQISEVAGHLTEDLQLRTECLASVAPAQQKRVLASSPPVDILIGTYSAIMSHIGAGNISTVDLQHLVVDEVESWLDFRTVDDNLPFLREFVDLEEGTTRCQVVLAGAILPSGGFTKLRDVIPDLHQYINPSCHVPHRHVGQSFHFVNNKNKPQHFARLITGYVDRNNMNFQRPLIFCNYKNTAYWLHKYLIGEGVNNIILHHSNSRRQKDELVRSEVPSTQYPIVTVDSASYGLDFRDIGLVVNYEFPFTYEDYIRRSGRTGRMSSNSSSCEVISYVSYQRDKALFNIVKNSTNERTCKAYSLLSPNKSGWVK